MTQQQLTYAAADRIPGRDTAGWGITYRSGATDPDVERILEEGVTLSLPVTMPDFPTAEQLATRPVRFRYRFDASSGRGYFWRSVEAGKDHTNRPGNVFTHGAAIEPAPSHPADLANSPDWLEPFRAEQVRAAIPAPELRSSDRDMVDVIFEWFEGDGAASRASVPWLTDAVMSALFADRSVGLVVPSPTLALRWISLITMLLPPHIGRRVSFSTWEDVHSLTAYVRGGGKLVGLLDQGVVAQAPGTMTVLDTTWSVFVQEGDERVWPLPGGNRVPVSKWSETAMDLVWLDAATVREVFAQRDAAYIELAAHLDPLSAARVALEIGMLAAQGAVVVDREAVLRAVLTAPDFPRAALTSATVSPLAAELGMAAPEPIQEAPESPDAAPTGPTPTGGFQPVEVYLKKDPEMPLSAHPLPRQATPSDPLDLFPSPTPGAVLNAVAMLRAGGQLALLDGPDYGLDRVDELDMAPEVLLALLYLAALNDSIILSDQSLADIHRRAGNSAERILPALLLLALRADVENNSNAVRTRDVTSSWFVDLQGHVASLDPPDLGFVYFHMDPAVRVFTCSPPPFDPQAPLAEHYRTFLDNEPIPQPASTWNFLVSTGATITECIRDGLISHRSPISLDSRNRLTGACHGRPDPQ